MISIPQQPQSVVEILETTGRIWASSFKSAFPFLLSMIVVLMARVAMVFVVNPNFALKPANSPIVISPVDLICSIILWILLLIIVPAMIYSIHKSVINYGASFSAAFFMGCRKAFPLLLVCILYSLIVLVGSIFLIIPGLIAAIYFLPSYFVVVVQDKGIIETLRYSANLVSGHWWRVAWLYALITTIFVMIISVIVFGLSFILFYLSFSQTVVVGIVMCLSLIVSSFLTQYLYAFGLAILYDLEIRKSTSS